MKKLRNTEICQMFRLNNNLKKYIFLRCLSQGKSQYSIYKIQHIYKTSKNKAHTYCKIVTCFIINHHHEFPINPHNLPAPKIIAFVIVNC